MNTISTFYTNALEGLFKSESAALFSNFDQKIQDILQLHTLTVNIFSVHLHARIFLLNPSDSFVKFSFFCMCHNRSEILANITAICNDIGWVILQFKHSNANVSMLHHRATLTLIENLENY